jgi:hypothetical protein
MEFWNDWWWGALVGQLLVASFAPMTGLMVWLFTRRWAGPRAAWVATLVYLSTPWVYRLAAIPYVEGPLCYYHAALLWGVGRAWQAPYLSRSRLWVAVGLLAGGAMAIKYPALISAVVPFGLVALLAAWRARNLSIVLGYALGVALVMSPWLIKNVIDTQNPVYPLGYNVFGGRFWDERQDVKWRNAHGPRPISGAAFVDSVLEVAGRSDWQSPLLTALAPLAFLNRGGRRISWLILGFVAYIFLTWWLFTHRLDRFWLPLLPGLAILAGIGSTWISLRVWTVVLGLVLFLGCSACFIYSSTALVALNDWTGNLNSLRRSVPQMLNPPLALMDTALAPNARPILVGQAAVFHLNHAVIYNTVFNKETIETLTRDRSDAEIRNSFKTLGLTHVYVDWHEIERYRSPGNYGFTDYVTQERLRGWVESGLLGPPQAIGQKQELYEIQYRN